jgi:hypothetical protein
MGYVLPPSKDTKAEYDHAMATVLQAAGDTAIAWLYQP